MRRGWILWILVVALLAAATWAVVHHRQTVPLDQCSNVYRHFADHRDIEASFIKDFRLNDTVQLSVTVLHAVSDSAWLALSKECYLPRAVFQNDSDTCLHSVGVCFVGRETLRPQRNLPYDERYFMVFDKDENKLYYFEVADRTQLYSINEYFIKKLND